MNRAVDHVNDRPVGSLTSLVIKSNQRVVNDHCGPVRENSTGSAGIGNGDRTIVDGYGRCVKCKERSLLEHLGSFDRCVKLLMEDTWFFQRIDQAEKDAWSGEIVVPTYPL